MTDKNTSSRIRAAVRKPNGHTQPVYGTPQDDGTLIDQDGNAHPAGSWFASRQAGSTEEDEE